MIGLAEVEIAAHVDPLKIELSSPLGSPPKPVVPTKSGSHQRWFPYATVDLNPVPAAVRDADQSVGIRVDTRGTPEQLLPFGHSRISAPTCLLGVYV